LEYFSQFFVGGSDLVQNAGNFPACFGGGGQSTSRDGEPTQWPFKFHPTIDGTLMAFSPSVVSTNFRLGVGFGKTLHVGEAYQQALPSHGRISWAARVLLKKVKGYS